MFVGEAGGLAEGVGGRVVRGDKEDRAVRVPVAAGVDA